MRLHCLLLCLAALATPAAAFDLQAHRGGRGLRPENTLPAFENAIRMGVDTLELDTAITKDGVVVVSHDPFVSPNLARTPDGQWLGAQGPAIHELTYEALSRYDVGRLAPNASYGRGFPQQVPVDGTRIPKLAQVFELAKRLGSPVRFNIETKVTPTAPGETLAPEAFAEHLVAEIRRAGMASRVTIQSFDWRTLQVVQRMAPEMPTVYLTARQRFLDNVCAGVSAGKPLPPAECEPSAWTAGFQLRQHGSVPKLVKAAGGSAWSPFWRDVDAAQVEEAHALGLKVIPWTVNEAAEMERLMGLRVDGIITDRPDVLREVMVRLKMSPPQGVGP